MKVVNACIVSLISVLFIRSCWNWLGSFHFSMLTMCCLLDNSVKYHLLEIDKIMRNDYCLDLKKDINKVWFQHWPLNCSFVCVSRQSHISVHTYPYVILHTHTSIHTHTHPTHIHSHTQIVRMNQCMSLSEHTLQYLRALKILQTDNIKQLLITYDVIVENQYQYLMIL